MKQLRRLLTLISVAISLCAVAQRTVTPVESDDKKPQSPTLHYYDKHGNPLDEPVLFLASLDTVQNTSNAARPVYPRLHAIDFGLNFADGILALAGQKYGGADLWASLSMWNWLFPTAEIGLGAAKNTPEGLNFTYKAPLSFYAKIGADYNFLYKSNPDYRVMIGARAGFSAFSYNISDITVNSPYWDQTALFSLPSQSAHALYGEVLAGLRVKIVRNFSLGWSFRYRFMFSCSDGKDSTPWYIPGYGPRNSHIGVSFSVIYTLPLTSTPPSENNTPEK